MRTMTKAKYVMSGFVLGTMFFGGIGFAASSSQAIQVSLQKILFKVDGVEKTTANGNYNNNGVEVPASFMYKGTNYLPMRMVAEMLGKEVAWDGKNSTVLIGSKLGYGKYLSDIAPSKFTGSVRVNTNAYMMNKGQYYDKGLSLHYAYEGTTIFYDLNAQYSELSAMVGIDDDDRPYNISGNLKIYGDDKEIYSSSFLRDAALQDLKLDLKGVMSLKIVLDDASMSAKLNIVNAFLKN